MPERWVVTWIGPAALSVQEARIDQAAVQHGFAIVGSRPLSHRVPAAGERLLIATQQADAAALRTELAELCPALHCDLALQRDDDARRSKGLAVFDMDSTLIRQEVIDELARACGIVDRVAAITHRAMNGEIDFDAALRERVGLLAGAPAGILDDVRVRIELTPGAERLLAVLKGMGCKTAVLSGGFTDVTLPFARQWGLDHAHANQLEIQDGALTGRVLGPIVNRKRKGELLQAIAAQEGVPLARVLAVGDGANDLDMLALAGLGVAFNARPVVRRQAAVALNQERLDTVLYLLGFTDDGVPV